MFVFNRLDRACYLVRPKSHAANNAGITWPQTRKIICKNKLYTTPSICHDMDQTTGARFKKDVTVAELFKMFPDDDTAMEWFEANIWKNGRWCPTCKNPSTVVSAHPRMPYYCNKCRSHFSVKKGTVMEWSKISYQKWAIATYMFAVKFQGMTSMSLHRDLGITQKSAWFLVQKLRKSWRILAGVDKMENP